MLNQTFKIVYVEYKPSYTTISDVVPLVTNIEYSDNYVKIEYHDRPDKTETRLIMLDTTVGIRVEEMDMFEAEKAWILMNNKSCGHDFERIKFWPFEGKKSEIQIYPRYGNRDGGYLLYTSVVGIQRKWNHDIKGNELYIRVIDFGQYAGFRNIEKIIIVPEEDIKKFVIQRTDHEDLVINVNGGTYRDE